MTTFLACAARCVIPGRLVWVVACLFVTPQLLRAETAEVLSGTRRLEWEGDIASRMIDGVDRFLLRAIEESTVGRPRFWDRDFSSVTAFEQSIRPQREQLGEILGLRDRRVTDSHIELQTLLNRSSVVGSADGYRIHAVRWDAVGPIRGEGLLLLPNEAPRAAIVALPDADQTPEQLAGLTDGIPAASQFARRLAENRCVVLVPALIPRSVPGQTEFEWNGRQHRIPPREFLYRSAYELGRHLVGYEVQQVLAGLEGLQDAFASTGDVPLPFGVWGYGEGGMIALYAAAVDARIQATVVSGYWQNRNSLWKQPIERNVFGLLEQFGDAEIATLIAPRSLIIEACAHPSFALPPGTGAAPSRLETPPFAEVAKEVRRARELLAPLSLDDEWMTTVGQGTDPMGQEATLKRFLERLLPESATAIVTSRSPATPEQTVDHATTRTQRQMRAIDRHNQQVLRDCARTRSAFFQGLDTTSVERFRETIEPYRTVFRRDVVGDFERELDAANPRSRKAGESDRVTYYEVVLDVYPDVFAYGILCLPKDIKEGERRPVVVCQHGLEGRPQDVIGDQRRESYSAFATQLAERGYVTFAPQNIYIFGDRFRTLQRKAYLLRKTIFAIMVPQHQQIVKWLSRQAFVDDQRIAFYGLSYGGKSAMRIPPLVPEYCLSICSADFNEWVDKNASTVNPRSYVWTGEYEIFEWNLGDTFNYAEMASLIAPRPFMVERGHFDGVADDWTVAWEYAKVRHLYQAQLKLADHTRIEWFDGPHRIQGAETFEFLDHHLDWRAHGE